MPITSGHEGRKAVIQAGGQRRDVFVFPKSLIDERMIHVAQVRGEKDGTGALDAAATYIACMARKQGGEAIWQDADEVSASMTAAEAEAAYRRILEVDEQIAQEMEEKSVGYGADILKYVFSEKINDEITLPRWVLRNVAPANAVGQ